MNKTKVNTTIKIAMAAEKFALPPISFIYSVYTMVERTLMPSPITIGDPKSAIAFIKTKSAPANKVGKIKGKTTVKTFLTGRTPKLSAASINEASIFCKAPLTYK